MYDNHIAYDYRYDDNLTVSLNKILSAVSENRPYSETFNLTCAFPGGDVMITHDSGTICIETGLAKISFRPTEKEFEEICSQIVTTVRDYVYSFEDFDEDYYD